jgi:hypothetical protein
MFLEQHADPTCASECLTPLRTACKFQFWDIIKMFLNYGADPPPPRLPDTKCRHLLHTSKLQPIRHAVLNLSTRRKTLPSTPNVPLLLRKTLASHHDAEDQPFPLDFFCGCSSNTTNDKRCSKRKFVLFRKWDKTRQLIVPCEAQQCYIKCLRSRTSTSRRCCT